MTISDSTKSTPLSHYLQLLNNVNPSDYTQLRTILTKSLSDMKLYSGFTDLRSHPTIVSASLAQNTSWGNQMLHTLDLFSFGVYQDYINNNTATTSNSNGDENMLYMPLNDAQIMKLRVLTIISIIIKSTTCATSSSPSLIAKHSMPNKFGVVIPYSLFSSELGLSDEEQGDFQIGDCTTTGTGTNSNRHLEDLLIHCIYNDLLPCGTKLDPKRRCLIVSYSSSSTNKKIINDEKVLCRDVNLNEPSTTLDEMITSLEEFHTKGKEMKNLLQQNLLNQVATSHDNDVILWKILDEEHKIRKDEFENSLLSSVGQQREVKRSRGLGRLFL